MVLSGQPVCFQCEYTGTNSFPRWRINEDEYPSANLPIEYEYSSKSGLCINEVDLSMNGSQFSCSFVTYFEVIESNIGHLTVIESTSEWYCFFSFFLLILMFTIDAFVVLLRPENKITALEGESVYFECVFFGTQLLPFWKINSQNFTSLSSYSTLPEGYSIKNDTKLLIEQVDLSMNNTQYSCGFSLYHGEIIESLVGYLAVIGTFYF